MIYVMYVQQVCILSIVVQNILLVAYNYFLCNKFQSPLFIFLCNTNIFSISIPQELAFIAGLVQLGAFHQNELLDVLHMLFPTKTEEAIQTLLARITEGLQNTEKQNV